MWVRIWVCFTHGRFLRGWFFFLVTSSCVSTHILVISVFPINPSWQLKAVLQLTNTFEYFNAWRLFSSKYITHTNPKYLVWMFLLEMHFWSLATVSVLPCSIIIYFIAILSACVIFIPWLRVMITIHSQQPLLLCSTSVYGSWSQIRSLLGWKPFLLTLEKEDEKKKLKFRFCTSATWTTSSLAHETPAPHKRNL